MADSIGGLPLTYDQQIAAYFEDSTKQIWTKDIEAQKHTTSI